jgi:hypothetical protein
VPILYGLIRTPPDYPCSLGGCCVTIGKSPTWHCTKCKEKFGVIEYRSEPDWLSKTKETTIVLMEITIVTFFVSMLPVIARAVGLKRFHRRRNPA